MEFSAAIIIPARDGAEPLRRLLASLARHLPPGLAVEVLVVDDGSQPPLEELLEPGAARVIRLAENRGPAHARNHGAAHAQGGLLFFLDADVVYERGALERALSILEAEPDVGAVSFLNQPYDAADGVVANFGAAMEHFWHSALIPIGADHGDCGGFTTRNGVVRREVFEAIRGFDTRYQTNAHEDYDIGKRLEAHTRTVLAASPRLYHAFPTRLRRIARNYWVRTSLFVPYFLKFRPPMDPTQVSGREAALRMSAVLPVVLLALALGPNPLGVPGGFFAAGAGIAAALYALWIRKFLAACWRWSGGKAGFTMAAYGIHLMTSWFILAGGVYGLWRHFRGDVPDELLSPIRQ